MSFNWDEYINLAEALLENNSDDARMRSATSRAYYGAFIQCRNYKGYNKSAFDIHQRVIRDLKTSDIKEETTLGSFLDTLRKKRNDADYNGFYNPNPRETSQHVQIAKRIVRLLDEVKNEN